MKRQEYISPEIIEIQVFCDAGFGVSDQAGLSLSYEDEMHADD